MDAGREIVIPRRAEIRPNNLLATLALLLLASAGWTQVANDSNEQAESSSEAGADGGFDSERDEFDEIIVTPGRPGDSIDVQTKYDELQELQIDYVNSEYFEDVDLDGTKLEGGQGDLKTVSFAIRANLVIPSDDDEEEPTAPAPAKQG